jgi:outer membrane protein OmpA-like peptidoglycan-associated protein
MKRFNPLAFLCAAALTSAPSLTWSADKANSQAASLEAQALANEKTPAGGVAQEAPVVPDGPTTGRSSTGTQGTSQKNSQNLLSGGGGPTHVVFAADSFFAFDRSDLRTDNVRTSKTLVNDEERSAVGIATRKLDLLAERLKGIDVESVGIYGHTDSDGSDAYNLKLALRRAESIRQYLIARGVPADKIQSFGEGERKPVADNATKEGRAKNRRVEIEIHGALAPK